MISPWHDKAKILLHEWELVKNAKSKGVIDAVNLQIERDSLEKWANHLNYNMLWCTSLHDIAEDCYQFERRLHNYKDKIIIEILTHGTI